MNSNESAAVRRSFCLKLAVATVLITGGTALTVACPFCGGPPSQTWAELIKEADVVVLGRLVEASEAQGKSPASSVVKIVEVLKGGDILAASRTGESAFFAAVGSSTDKQLLIPEFLFGEPGDLFILNARLHRQAAEKSQSTFGGESFTADDSTESDTTRIQTTSAVSSVDEGVRRGDVVAASFEHSGLTLQRRSPEVYELVWELQQQITLPAFRYIAAAPPADADLQDRLSYFAPFLESPDEAIATDAWSEFAGASYEDVVAVRHVLSPEKLRTWIANKETSPQRLGLYGMMLGLCGSPSDAAFLKDQIGLPVNDDIRFGVDGLMGGLLLLTDEDGLAYIEHSRLSNAAASTMEVMAAMQAVQFIREYEPDRFPVERLKQSLRLLLNREDLREIAIRNLSRWEDWETVTRLPDVYDACRKQDRRSTEAVVGFLLALRKSSAEERHQTAAADLLERIRTDDPRLVRSTERFLP